MKQSKPTHMDTAKLQYFISNPLPSLIKSIEAKYSSHMEAVDSRLGGLGGGGMV